MIVNAKKYSSLIEMREIVFNIYPETNERIMYGGIIFSLYTEYFSGIFVRQKHIPFEFSKGFLMKDPNNYLEGNEKFRRHLKNRTKEDIENKKVLFFVKQALYRIILHT